MASNAINSVTSQPQQAPQARQPVEAEAAKRDVSAAEREKQLRAQQQAQQQAQAQERRPVTNTQGQVTGTIINTTA